MLKHTTKFTSLLLAAGTCFSGTICTFAESTSSADAANATEVFSTPLYTSGLYSTNEQPEGVKVTHNICLDYDNNLMKDNYLIQNESDTDVSFDILIPQIASLASEPEKLYNFYAHAYDTTDSDALKLLDLFADTDAASFEESSYYSPLFSANGLGESTLTLDELYQGQIYNTSIPEDKGVLYHLSRPLTDSVLDEKVCLSISGLSDSCHIYPLGCSYSTTDNGYELSLIENENAKTDAEKFSMDDESSDLKSYLEFCCDWYLEQNKDTTQATPELLLSNLADYFGRSSVTVSIDLLPTIDWLTQQKRFLVHQYTVTVPAGSSIFAWTERNTELSKKEVTLSAQLSKDTASYAKVLDTVTVSLPDGYSSLIVRNAESKKLSDAGSSSDNKLITYSIQSYKGDTYSVALFKTPMWNATLKYMPIFIVIMAVFMLLCLISYLSRRKKS